MHERCRLLWSMFLPSVSLSVVCLLCAEMAEQVEVLFGAEALVDQVTRWGLNCLHRFNAAFSTLLWLSVLDCLDTVFTLDQIPWYNDGSFTVVVAHTMFEQCLMVNNLWHNNHCATIVHLPCNIVQIYYGSTLCNNQWTMVQLWWLARFDHGTTVLVPR